MKNYLTLSKLTKFFSVAVLLVSLLTGGKAYASHAAGANITYTHITGNQYRIRVEFYRDCAGIAAPASFNIRCSSSCGNINATALPLAGTGVEITYPCATSTTTCNGGTTTGLQEWVYEVTVTLPATCANWVFATAEYARNAAITTIVTPGSDSLYVEATLNNTTVQNSSIQFSNNPVLFVCTGQDFQFNNGAIDPEGDSLAYSFVCARLSQTTCVTYVAGFSFTNPITSVPAVAINGLTGQITMHPTVAGQVGVITMLIKEYRNGVLIGSTLRDIQVYTQACTNNPPTTSGINGTGIFNTSVCAGSQICFDIPTNDIDGAQVTTITWNSGIAGATFTSTGTPHATGHFCWQTVLADSSSTPYQFTVTVRDNNCPSNAVAIYAFDILVGAVHATATATNPTCSGGLGSATVTASGGLAPYTYLWSPGGQTTQTVTGLTSGTYSVTVTDVGGCPSSVQTVTIVAPAVITSGITAQTNVNCNGQSNGSATITAAGGTPAYTYSWSPSGGTGASATGLSAGTYTLTITDSRGCTSTQVVAITQPAVLTAGITSTTNVNCNGQSNGSATVTAGGGTAAYTYSWSPSGGTGATGTGLSAGTYTVTITDSHGCTTTQTAVITQPAVLTAGITATTNVNCNGQSNGSATVTAGGGTAAYTYSWSPSGGTGATGTGLSAGTYTVTVTDSHGCTTTQTAVITQPAVLTAGITATTNVNCNGQSNGSATVTAGGGTAAYTYSWSPSGGTGATGTGLSAGTYTVTVTDSHGCSTTQTTTITQPVALAATTTHTNVLCNGGASGTATVSATGGTVAYTYSWNTVPVQTTATATGLSAGTYTVTVTDSHGCTTTQTVTITNPVGGTLNGTVSSITKVDCFGNSTGSATVSISGGTAPYTYLWSPGGQTTATAVGLSAGTYTCTITDANGCTNTQTAVIGQPVAPLTANASVIANVNCNGQSNGSASVTAAGGTPAYTYLWSPSGGTGATATGLSAGTYTVTISDAAGCANSTQVVTITQPTALAGSITASVNVNCFGQSNGSATVTAGGGTAAYTYSWSPSGGTGATGTGLTAGTYTVTVTDSHGCLITRTVTITQPTALSATTSHVDATCNASNGSASVTASGGTAGYTYSWSPIGGTGTTATGLSAGSYVVTVTDAHGCTTTQIAAVSNIGGPTATASVVANVNCNGQSNGSATVTVTGGTAPFTYLWSPTGGTGVTATGLSAGTYGISVTDLNGCVSSQTVTITQPAVLTAATSVTNANCSGQSNGSATVTAGGGTAGYTYSWSPSGGTGTTATGLSAGTYTVTVTDSHGCTTTQTATIGQPTVLTAAISSSTNANCNGQSNGSATVTAGGGTPGYTYSWSPSGGTGATATGLSAGNYTVTITDSHGCSTTQTTTIGQPTVLVAAISSSVNVNCNGQSNGSAAVTASGGTAAYTYSWSPSGGTGASATGLSAGTYTITVTDSHGCTTTQTTTITQPAVLTASITSSTNVSCNAGSNGTATVTAGGGTAAYTYSWSPSGGTGATGTGLTAGTYTVTITDAHGCTTTRTVTITQPTALSLSTSHVDAACGQSNGSASVTASGGTGAYTYSWSPIGGTGTSATGLSAGTYVITVTDANGCSTPQSVTVNNLNGPTAQITSSTNVACNGGSGGSATVSASGGATPYTYSWSPSGGTGATATGLSAGTYIVTVTDALGCLTAQQITITQPEVLAASISSSTNVACNGGSSGSATVTVSGGTGPYTYSWSPIGGNGATAGGLTVGSYTVSITDSHGCTTQQTVAIDEPTVLVVASISHTDATCGGFNGTATVSASGGTPIYTYVWNTSPIQIGATATGLSAGTYTVGISDANGCITGTTVTVNNLQGPVVTFESSTNPLCNGGNDGTATVSVTNGTQPLTYSWSPTGGTGATGTGLSAGTYIVTATDANGCFGIQTVNIGQPTAVNVQITTGNATCGQANGSATASVSGGTPGYTYLWNDAASQTTPTATGLLGGNYIVTVTDANGCSSQTQVNVPNFGAPTAVAAVLVNVSCNGGSNGIAGVSASGGTGAYTYSWSPSGGNAQIANGLSAGTYVVTVTDATGCLVTQSVTVTQPAVLTASSSFNQPLCNRGSDGSATAIPAGGTPGYTYLWNDALAQTTATANGLTAGTYNCIVTDALGCSTQISATVTEPAALTTNAGQAQKVCATSASLSAQQLGSGLTGTWTLVSGTGVFANPNNPSTQVSGMTFGSNVFQWTIMNSNECTASAEVTVEAFEYVRADALTPDSTMCLSDFVANMQGSFTVSGTVPVPGTGSWSVLSGSGSFSNPQANITQYNITLPSNVYNTNVSVLLYNVDNGPCHSQDSVVLKLQNEGDCLELDLPTGYTPNGDQFNDSYIIHGIEKYPDNKFMVFNRWGNEVFSVDNYKNNGYQADWHGQNNSGKDLPEGTYYVILLINKGEIKRNTYVDLRK